MLDQTMIDRYLEDVDSYLHVDRAHRQRVLDEIEGHLHDAVDAHITQGARPQEAMQRAIAEVGPPADVATQFVSAPAPSRSVRGWRRWMPIVLPAAVLATGVTLSAWHLLMVRHGVTYGRELALRRSVLYTAVAGTLTAAAYVATRNGDRDPAWRRAAWGFAVLAGVIPAMSVVL